MVEKVEEQISTSENTEVLYSYSRAQAIEDGSLIDVTQIANEVGIKYPVAVTSSVWARCISVSPDEIGQSEKHKLWNVLRMLFLTIRTKEKIRGNQDAVQFNILVQRTNNIQKSQFERLWAICGPGDNLEPVITIMMEGED